MDTDNKKPNSEPAGLTRRSFINTAAAAGAVLTIPVAATAQVGGSDTIKVALVGCGGRGSGAANQALNNEGVEPVAMADAYSDRLEGSLKNLKKQRGDRVKVNFRLVANPNGVAVETLDLRCVRDA